MSDELIRAEGRDQGWQEGYDAGIAHAVEKYQHTWRDRLADLRAKVEAEPRSYWRTSEVLALLDGRCSCAGFRAATAGGGWAAWTCPTHGRQEHGQRRSPRYHWIEGGDQSDERQYIIDSLTAQLDDERRANAVLRQELARRLAGRS